MTQQEITIKEFEKLKQYFIKNNLEIDFSRGWYTFQFKFIKISFLERREKCLIYMSPSLDNPKFLIKHNKKIVEDCNKFMDIIK